jgi:hypothetical protein
MTSGQGGSEQEPTGPGQQGQDGAPGWNQPAPQQPPSYPAAPPPSYPSAPPAAPPSYPAAPGHGGAQWGGPAPRPVERPVTVRAGIGAFMASLILGVIGVIIRFTDIDTLVDQALAQTVQAGQEQLSRDVARSLVIIVAVISLVFIGLEAMFIWFAWNGRNWARIVLWVIGGFGVLSLLFVLGGSAATSSTGFLDALSIIQSLLVLAGVILLALAPSNEWYRYRRWLRDTGQAH